MSAHMAADTPISLEYRAEYNVDIVMCIDATGSMKYLLDTVKDNALNFYDDLTRAMERSHRSMSSLRVRVIVFRDYLADGKDAMLATDFYDLPAEAHEFERLVRSVQYFGGGDRPEDGLEALAYAMRSDWTPRTGTARCRHVIVVWTDDGTHKLGFGNGSMYYPNGMAKDFDELTEWWGDGLGPGVMDRMSRRLVIYAPDKPYWSTIADNWDQVNLFPSIAGEGLSEYDYQELLAGIVNSIAL